ncbi:hypothetical protein INQ41_11720 [Lysobacter ciconiae]|uniref:VanZ-like domain-containing protein n=1 Tax=Novilysobacter ciconiae TaxID=2781022 RepID=A0A7S6UFE3_9GAMM|nr:hypothetical protein [Lysobacter ciconiae]QOW19281.1 hypothetical protein INQ41_11720 [Lysobacter ciconiae]
MTTAPQRLSLMRPFRRPWLWLSLWLLLFVLVAAGSLMSADKLPPVDISGFDKVQHFVGYAVLSAGAVALFARLRTQSLIALVIIGFGIGLEFAQASLTTDRMGDVADALANTLGVLGGLLLSSTPAARWLQRLDARLP